MIRQTVLLALAAACLCAPRAGLAGTAEIPGYDRMDVHARHRAAPLAVSIWYPAGAPTYRIKVGTNAVFKGETAMLGAAVADGRHPLVVLSHGSGGAMDGLAWLSARLAQRGAMVVAVNHPGTTSGDSSPRRTLRLAPRAADLGAALDAVLSDPELARSVDRDRIAALGFSLGGSTVLGLAGLRLDADEYASYCRPRLDTDPGCRFLTRGGVKLSDIPESFSADMLDRRFTRIVAVDPGFTHAAARDSLPRVRAEILLVNLGREHRWPAVDVGPDGSGLSEALPGADHAVIAPAHHFSFLPLCQPNGAQVLREEGDDPVCDDPPGSNRAAVHDAVVEAVARFLRLEGGTGTRAPD